MECHVVKKNEDFTIFEENHPMNQQLLIFQWTRQNMIHLIGSIPEQKLVSIPEGFANSILWNAGHIYWAHQILVYKFAELAPAIPEHFSKIYATGTTPTESDQYQVAEVLDLLQVSTIKTVEDYEQGKFKLYKPFSGEYDTVKYQLNNWEEAFQYNNIHEARHYGFMVALAKVLG